MERHVCPPWVGYMLINPLRNLIENPIKLLSSYVREGMMIIEPGCGMGFFTIPLAKMVGPTGKVVAIDMQPVMLEKVRKRARRAGLEERIDCRLVEGSTLSLEGYAGKADLAVALHVVHEVPDHALFFAELAGALKNGGKLLVHEPASHVSETDFEQSLGCAEAAGFRIGIKENVGGSRRAEVSVLPSETTGVRRG